MIRPFLAPETLSLEIVWAKNHRFDAGWSDFAPRVACASLWQVLRGEVRVEADGQTQIAGAHDWVWRAPSGARRVEVGEKGASWRSVGLVAMRGGKNWFAPTQSQNVRLEAETAARGAALMALLTDSETQNGFERDDLARALLGWWWGVAKVEAAPDFPPWLQHALRQIEANPAVTVGELARGAHFSGAQFRRLWDAHLGQSPRETLVRRRLEIARKWLEEGEWSVGEVAARSGFAGAAQFSRAFRAGFGVSPLEWRRAGREKM